MLCRKKMIKEANRIQEGMQKYLLTDKDAYKTQTIAIMLFETGETLTEANMNKYEAAYRNYVDNDDITFLSNDIRKYIFKN